MDLKQLKNEVDSAGFSREGTIIINNLLAKAEKRGYLEKEERDELNGIIDLEIEGAQIEADAEKEVAGVLNECADGVEDKLGQAIAELEQEENELAAAPPKPPHLGQIQ
ncbi:MAG: hypothetical protein MUD10_03500 [Candidatus Pacebacteria bacterium]|jgi:hypothetical protein|nr:hypothetical protein [Candidatus Paceibacterota bacterium]